MAFNGTGTYSAPVSSWNPAADTVVINSTDWNALLSDLSTALSTTFCKDGQSTPSANLPMGGYRLTNLGAATATTDAIQAIQVRNQSLNWCGTAGGTADAITLTPSIAVAAYVAGQKFCFISSGANTTAVTVAVSGLAAKNVTKKGTTALVAGDIPSGAVIDIEYDGTQFQLASPLSGLQDSTLTAKGDLISASAANTPVALNVGTNGYVLTADSTQTSGLKWAAAGSAYTTIQVFTSASGTYTLPAGAKAIRVRVLGGGSSGSTVTTAGNAGTQSTFGTLTAGGGAAPPAGNSTSAQGAGGTAANGDINIPGGQGGCTTGSVVGLANQGGSGGTSVFGGSGAGGVAGGAAVDGQAGATNSGAGGGGGSAQTGNYSGFGGNAGGYVEKIISSPSATYSYAVGGGGALVSAPASGGASGAGAAGIIIVEEAY